MVTLVIFQDYIMGAKSSVYRIPLIDRACKVNVNVKQRHWFYQPWFNRGWLFKDYQPSNLKSGNIELVFCCFEKWELWILNLLDNWWTWGDWEASLSQFESGVIERLLYLNLHVGQPRGFSILIWMESNQKASLSWFEPGAIKRLLYLNLKLEAIKRLLYLDLNGR